MKEDFISFKTAFEVKRSIPPDATLSLSYKKHSIESVSVKYAVYPIRIAEHSPFLLDLDGAITNPSPQWGKIALSTGAVLYDKEGRLLPGNLHPAPRFHPIKALLIFLLTFIYHCAAGFMVCAPGLDIRRKGQRLWYISICYLTGVIVVTLIVWTLLLMHMPLNFRTLALGNVIIAVFSVLSYFYKDPAPAVLPAANGRSTRGGSFFKIFFLLILTLLILGSIAAPVHDWDTMVNWLNKANVLAHERSLNLHYTYASHNYYPLLWPMHIAIQYVIQSGIFDEVAKWSSAAALGCFFVFLTAALRILKVPPPSLWLTLIVFIGLFIGEYPANSAIAENMFLAILTGLICCVLLWIDQPGNHTLKIIIIILSLGINLIKLEGGFVTLFVILSLLYARASCRLDRPSQGLMIPLAITLALPVLWFLWVKHAGLSPPILHLQDPLSVHKATLIFVKGLEPFFMKGEALVFLLMAMTFRFFPNSRRWHAGERFLLALAVFLIAFRWLAVLGWSEALINNEGIFPDACSRLFLHAAPSLSLLWASRIFHRTG